MAASSSKRYFLFVLKAALILICAYYLYTQFSENVSSLGSLRLETQDAALLLAAFTSMAVFFSVKVAFWRHILSLVGAPLAYNAAASIWFGSQTIKYLPGKIWFLMGRFYLARGKVENSQTFAATGIEVAMMLLSGTLAFFVFAGRARLSGVTYYLPGQLILVLVAMVSVVAIHPRVLRHGFVWIAKITRRSQPDVRIGYAKLLRLLVLYVANWSLFGLGNFLLLRTFGGLGWESLGEVIGYSSLSYVIGFLSFLTPGGMGVREAVLVYLLTPLSAPTVAVTVAMGSRISWMVCEVLGTAAFLGVGKLMDIKNKIAELKENG